MLICRNAEEVHGQRNVGNLCLTAFVNVPTDPVRRLLRQT